VSLQGLDKWITGDGRFDTNQCIECGKQVPEGEDLCGHCAAENRDVEFDVNDYREERDL
jgi:hypothetical protein